MVDNRYFNCCKRSCKRCNAKHCLFSVRSRNIAKQIATIMDIHFLYGRIKHNEEWYRGIIDENEQTDSNDTQSDTNTTPKGDNSPGDGQ